MKLTLEPTEDIVADPDTGEALARYWKGEDDHGVPVLVLIQRVIPQTHDDAVHARYSDELLTGGVHHG